MREGLERRYSRYLDDVIIGIISGAWVVFMQSGELVYIFWGSLICIELIILLGIAIELAAKRKSFGTN